MVLQSTLNFFSLYIFHYRFYHRQSTLIFFSLYIFQYHSLSFIPHSPPPTSIPFFYLIGTVGHGGIQNTFFYHLEISNIFFFIKEIQNTPFFHLKNENNPLSYTHTNQSSCAFSYYAL